MLHVETGLIQLYIVRLISKLALGNKATDRSLGMAYLNPTVAELLNSYDPKKDGANEFCFEFTPVEEVTKCNCGKIPGQNNVHLHETSKRFSQNLCFCKS